MTSLPADNVDRCRATRPSRRIGRRIAWAWLVACLLPAAAASQEPVAPQSEAAAASAAAEPSAASPPQRLTGPIQYVGPDTYILLDDQGRPQPVLGMSYDEFMAVWKESQHLGAAESQPRYTIQNVHIHGRARQRRAELEIELTVRLLSDQPVTVPLGLAGAILRSRPEITSTNDSGELPLPPGEGRGEGNPPSTGPHPNPLPQGEEKYATYLDYDPQRGGFMAGLRGRPGDERTLKLQVFVPLMQSGNETTLELSCPRALVGSLSLDVDSAVVEASVTDGSVLSRAPIDGSGTRLSATGLAGPFRLSWKTAEPQRAELATVLSATGAILVSIDGRSVQTDAHLTVRSYGGSFDRFRVRLPPGAKLIQDRYAGNGASAPGYHVTLEGESTTGDAPPGSAPGRQVVLVELASKQPGPVEVDLSTEQPLGLVEAGRAVELAGFEVLGAVRQYGDAGLRAADDWQLRWEIGRNVRQVEPSDLASQLQQQPLTAAFQYDRQPWSLGVRVAARQFRIHVAPEYGLDWLPDEARLRVHLTYQVLGARAFEFRVQLHGWELTADSIESGGLVDRDRVLLTDEGLLVLPLVGAAPRRAEITFQLRRAIDRKQERIELPLPTPLADSVATGDLVVHAAAGIELAPDASRSTGLEPTLATDVAAATDGDGRPEFRYRCLVPEATFAAERIVRSREVTIEAVTRLDVSPGDARVEERLSCLVRYEPLRELVLDVPESWPQDNAQIEAVLIPAVVGSDQSSAEPQETPLSLVSSGEETSPAGGSRVRRVRVPLGQPRLGRFGIALRYTMAQPADLSRGGPWSIPLAQPVEGQVVSHRATVRAPRQWSIGLDPATTDSAWQPVDRSHSAATMAGSLRGEAVDQFVATAPQLTLPLVFESVDLAAPSATIVQRVWLQAWLSGDVLQQRAAFRFRSDAPVVAVELPPDVLPQEVEVLLDGQLAALESRDGGRLVVALPAVPAGDEQAGQPAGGDHTLELRYRRPSAVDLVVRRRWTPPQLAGLTALSELYWHVVLPGDMHLVRWPQQLTPTGRWQWLGNFWSRRPEKTQAELEEWVGATAQLVPSAAQNQYLFSGLAPVASIEVVTMPRWLVVLAASGAIVALALAWIYVPAVRRGWIVIGLAACVAVLAVAFPTPAMLFGQAAVLGLVVATIAVVLERLLVRPAAWSRSGTGSSLLRPATSRSDSFPTPAVGTSTGASPVTPRPVSDSQR